MLQESFDGFPGSTNSHLTTWTAAACYFDTGGEGELKLSTDQSYLVVYVLPY